MSQLPHPIDRVAGIKESKVALGPKIQKKGAIQNHTMEQIAAKQAYESYCREGFNEIAIRRNFQTLEEQQKTKKYSKGGQVQEEHEEQAARIEEVSKTDEAEARTKKQNPELEKKQLILLRASITEKDSAEDILQKVLEAFADYTLADEALDYLLETTKGELADRVKAAKELLYDNFKREIIAGKNMSLHARALSSEGVGSPSQMRDMYRDLTGNPQDPNLLFARLAEKYNFGNLRKVIRFLLHSLGSDLKSKGPSIPRGELYKLFTDVRTLQAILGVYLFFNSRMRLISSQFRLHSLLLPSQVSTETMAKIFMKLLNERYLASEKLIKDTQLLGIFDEIQAQIILLTQFRDATRQIAPRLYKNAKQKEELLSALIDTLEELEEELEEEEEKEDSEKREKGQETGMKDWFEKLIKALGIAIDIDIEVEEGKIASLIVDGELILHLELDETQSRLLVISMLEELLPGKFRDKILIKALQENGKEKKVAILGFSEKNMNLVLFQYLPERALNAEFLSDYLNTFIDIAFIWKKAIKNNDLVLATLEIKK